MILNLTDAEVWSIIHITRIDIRQTKKQTPAALCNKMR